MDLLQEFEPGIYVLIWYPRSKVRVLKSGGPERVPPEEFEEPFSEPFRPKAKNEVMFFSSEFDLGSRFEFVFRFVAGNPGGAQISGAPFLAKTIGYSERPCFFRLGPFFGKVCFSNFRDPDKEHPGAPRRHSSNPISIRISKRCVCFRVFFNFQFSEAKG